MNYNNFDNLLAAYLDNDISEQQLIELHQMVQTSSDLRNRFQQETRLHLLLHESQTEQVELNNIQRSVSPPRNKLFSHAITAAAALLLIALTIFFSIYNPSPKTIPHIGTCMSISGNGNLSIQRNAQYFNATTETPLIVGDRVICDPHTQAMLRLADGSILSMEPNSAITLISNRPEVSLQKGVVFFEIAPRESNASPFQVLTGQSTVDVMGTVFSLAANDHTELKVYEGSVTLTRHRDNVSVSVKAQQSANTANENLTVENLSTSTPATNLITLTPTDDITLDRGKPDTDPQLKIEGKRRIVYLRFNITNLGDIRSARLRLTQDVDPGQGTLRFFLGDHANWNEHNISHHNAPKQSQLITQYSGVVRRGQIIDVDISNAIKTSGPLTIIMTLNKTQENDIWFASKESDNPPQLILSYLPHN